METGQLQALRSDLPVFFSERIDRSGSAMADKELAKDYAKKNDLIFLEGSEVIEDWKKWSG